MKELLLSRGQGHVLRYMDELSAFEREEFFRQVEGIDWEQIQLIGNEENCGEGLIRPIDIMRTEEIEARRDELFAIGADAIKSGKLACILLAGGQGTRLGSDAPKGAFDIGITRPLYIFELLIKNLLEVANACKDYPPFFVMTSAQNDEYTRKFFREHSYFGYPKRAIRFYRQKTAVCTDFSGNLLLESKGRLASSPNGNGGWFTSLLEADLLKEFPSVEWFNVFSVDNVLQRIADPIFFGATLKSGANCGAKGVSKAYPEEKVGVLCLKDGLPSVIEYYDLSRELAEQRDQEGRLVYSFGVTLNYLFSRKKLEEVAGENLPVHIVKKKIPYLNEKGERVVPEHENGYKFETLILDLVRLMETCLPFEVVREKEFAPVKNKTGVDSVDSARELLRLNGIEL